MTLPRECLGSFLLVCFCEASFHRRNHRASQKNFVSFQLWKPLLLGRFDLPFLATCKTSKGSLLLIWQLFLGLSSVSCPCSPSSFAFRLILIFACGLTSTSYELVGMRSYFWEWVWERTSYQGWKICLLFSLGWIMGLRSQIQRRFFLFLLWSDHLFWLEVFYNLNLIR